jgi:hypothetical protein
MHIVVAAYELAPTQSILGSFGIFFTEHGFRLGSCGGRFSGHRIGTAEVESALVSHPQCAEAAVVGFDHEVDHFSWVVVIVETSLFSSFW